MAARHGMPPLAPLPLDRLERRVLAAMRLAILVAACIAALGVPLGPPTARGQDAEPEHIETDRDSFTPATTVVGSRRVVLESAYSFIDNRTVADTHSLPELLARYGVTDWLELRFGANYEVGGESSSVSGSGPSIGDLEAGEIESAAKVSYGFKAALTEQDGWLPRSVTILQGNTPTSGAETATHIVATYAYGWTLAPGWEWDSSIRYGDGSLEEDDFNRWAPSTVLKVEVAEDWLAHIEYFGGFTDGRADELSESFISPGVHHLLTPNIELGLRVGWGISRDAANFFSNAGLGLRF